MCSGEVAGSGAFGADAGADSFSNGSTISCSCGGGGGCCDGRTDGDDAPDIGAGDVGFVVAAAEGPRDDADVVCMGVVVSGVIGAGDVGTSFVSAVGGGDDVAVV